MNKPEQHGISQVINQPIFRETVTWLRKYKQRTDNEGWSKSTDLLSELKCEAVSQNDQLTAKTIWCLETIYEVQRLFWDAFHCMEAEHFQEAWQFLERCENAISSLAYHFTDEQDEYGINYIATHVKRFQDLYPYVWGMSPELLLKDVRCSICGAKITLRSDCGHEMSEIYDGKMCIRVVKAAEILGIGLVDEPVQKYSVFFPNGDDDDRLSLVKSVAAALNSPWDAWDYRKEERRQYHSAFQNLGRNEPCACGSGIKYKRCCINEETVFPHFEIMLSGQPKTPLIEPTSSSRGWRWKEPRCM